MNEIITSVVGRMSPLLETDQLERLKIVLMQTLSDYDITEKPHELATCSELNEQYVVKFIAWKATEGKSKGTLKQYKFQIEKMLSAVNKPIPEITEDDLFLYIAMVKQGGASNRYLNNIRLNMSSFFGWLYGKSMITKNPVNGISSIKTEKTIKMPFTDVEMEMMRRSIIGKRNTALFEFLYATGVRVSEACGVNIADIDFANKSVKVFGKGSKERVVFMNNTTIWHLRQYLQERGYDDGALFLNRNGQRMKPACIEEILRKISRDSGVSNVHPHRFRRTLATNLLKKGMKIEEVSKILGHAKLDTTMIYCDIDSDIVKNNYSRIMTA